MGFKADKKFVAILMSGLLLVIIGQVVPLVGSTVEDSYDMPVDTAGTGTYTQSGNITLPEYNVTATLATVVIGSETFTFSNTTGAFAVNVAGGNNNTSQSLAFLVAEINANSTLVTAVDNGDNTTTITSVLEDAAGNYATTETVTNGAFAATAMTGGVTGSEWEDVTNTSDVWGNLVTILGAALSLLAIFYAISPIIGKDLFGGK